MCKAIKDGGQRCPEHRRDVLRLMEHAAEETGAPASVVRAAFIYGRDQSEKAGIGRAYDQETIEEGVSYLLMDAETSQPLGDFDFESDELPDLDDLMMDEPDEAGFVDYSADGDMDGDTFYSLRSLKTYVEDHQYHLERHLLTTATRLGMTPEQVEQTFEVYHTQASTNPKLYPVSARDQVRLLERHKLLPDTATLSALARLEQEGVRGKALVTRRPVYRNSPALKEGGYDPETGRLEIVTRADPDKVMSWQGVPKEVWDEFTLTRNFGFSLLKERVMGLPIYQYQNQREADREGYMWHCRGCGQFANSSHVCPYRGREDLDGGASARDAQLAPPPLSAESPTEPLPPSHVDASHEDLLDGPGGNSVIVQDLDQVKTPTERYKLSEGVETSIQWMNVSRLRTAASTALPVSAPLDMTFTIPQDSYDEYGNHLTAGKYRVYGKATVMSLPGGEYAFVYDKNEAPEDELTCETCNRGIGQPEMGCVHLRYAAAHLPNVAQQMEEMRVRTRTAPAKGLPKGLGDYAHKVSSKAFKFTADADSFSERKPVAGSLVRPRVTLHQAMKDTPRAYREFLMATASVQAPPAAKVLSITKTGRRVEFMTRALFDGGKHEVTGSVSVSPGKRVNLSQLRCSCGRFVAQEGTCEHVEALGEGARIYTSPWVSETLPRGKRLTVDEFLDRANENADEDSVFASPSTGWGPAVPGSSPVVPVGPTEGEEKQATDEDGDRLRAGIPLSIVKAAALEREVLESSAGGQELTELRRSRVEEFTRAEAERAAANQLASERERQQMGQKLANNRINYAEYRKDQEERWNTPEGALEADEVKQIIAKARASRRKGKEDERTYRKSGVTDGVCDPSIPGSRRFGVELEYDLPSTFTPEQQKHATANILKELREAGMTSQDKFGGVKAGAANGWKEWSLERDFTVGGELVSPLLSDSEEDWEKLETAITILKRNGAIVSHETGMHVHVSSGSYDNSTAKHLELNQIFEENADTLYRLAADPARGTRRTTTYCDPNVTTLDMDSEVDGYGINQPQPAIFTDRNQAVNFIPAKTWTAPDGQNPPQASEDWQKHHVEFRLWDGSLNASTIQQQVATSVALTERADRVVEKGGHSVQLRGANQPLGSHHHRGEDSVELSPEALDALVAFASDTFRTKEQQRHFFRHFGYNKWQK